MEAADFVTDVTPNVAAVPAIFRRDSFSPAAGAAEAAFAATTHRTDRVPRFGVLSAFV